MDKHELEEKLEKLKDKQELIDQAWRKTGNKDLLDFFVDILPRALDAARCSIFVFDPESDSIWVKAGTGLEEQQIRVPKERSMVGEVIRTGKAIERSDMENKVGAHEWTAMQTGFTVRNALCVPVFGVTKEGVVGALQVLNKKSAARFSDEDRQILERLANLLQINIENIFLRQEMAKVSQQMRKKIQTLEAKLNRLEGDAGE